MMAMRMMMVMATMVMMLRTMGGNDIISVLCPNCIQAILAIQPYMRHLLDDEVA